MPEREGKLNMPFLWRRLLRLERQGVKEWLAPEKLQLPSGWGTTGKGGAIKWDAETKQIRIYDGQTGKEYQVTLTEVS